MSSSDPRAAGTAHSRFIPREELEGFAAWRPNAFAGAGATDAADARGAEARAAAEALLGQPTVKAALRAAREAGYQDGYRDGLVALESFKSSFARQASAQLGALVAAFDAEFERLEQQLAAGVAEAATALARQVVRSELTQRPGAVAAVAAEAVQALLLGARQVRVRVHPDDRALVAEGAAEALAARGAVLTADAAVARGGVCVESDLGRIDATVATRWAQAACALGVPSAANAEPPHVEPLRAEPLLPPAASGVTITPDVSRPLRGDAE